MNKLLKLFIAGAVFFPIISTAADKYQKEISNDLVTKFSNAREQRRSGDLNKSIAALRAIVATRSDYYLANYNLALALTDAKKYAEAEKYYLLSIEIAKQKKIVDNSIYNSFGWMQLTSGDFIEAEKQFDIALANISKMPTEDGKRKAYNNSGLNYIFLGKYSDAERVLTIAANQYSSQSAISNLQLLRDIKSRQEKK